MRKNIPIKAQQHGNEHKKQINPCLSSTAKININCTLSTLPTTQINTTKTKKQDKRIPYRKSAVMYWMTSVLTYQENLCCLAAQTLSGRYPIPYVELSRKGMVK